MTLSLAFICPVLAEAAMGGRLPRGFCIKRLTDLPMLWSELLPSGRALKARPFSPGLVKLLREPRLGRTPPRFLRVYQVRGEIGAHRLQSAPTKFSSGARKRPSSVAIMPFRASSGDEDQRFLAEGLTEELIVELGRFRRLCVASRSASFAMATTNPDPVLIGEALRVRYVLDGQVRKIGKTIRIGLTLSETEAGSVVWSDKITRPFENLLDILDERGRTPSRFDGSRRVSSKNDPRPDC